MGKIGFERLNYKSTMTWDKQIFRGHARPPQHIRISWDVVWHSSDLWSLQKHNKIAMHCQSSIDAFIFLPINMNIRYRFLKTWSFHDKSKLSFLTKWSIERTELFSNWNNQVPTKAWSNFSWINSGLFICYNILPPGFIPSNNSELTRKLFQLKYFYNFLQNILFLVSEKMFVFRCIYSEQWQQRQRLPEKLEQRLSQLKENKKPAGLWGKQQRWSLRAHPPCSWDIYKPSVQYLLSTTPPSSSPCQSISWISSWGKPKWTELRDQSSLVNYIYQLFDVLKILRSRKLTVRIWN